MRDRVWVPAVSESPACGAEGCELVDGGYVESAKKQKRAASQPWSKRYAVRSEVVRVGADSLVSRSATGEVLRFGWRKERPLCFLFPRPQFPAKKTHESLSTSTPRQGKRGSQGICIPYTRPPPSWFIQLSTCGLINRPPASHSAYRHQDHALVYPMQNGSASASPEGFCAPSSPQPPHPLQPAAERRKPYFSADRSLCRPTSTGCDQGDPPTSQAADKGYRRKTPLVKLVVR